MKAYVLYGINDLKYVDVPMPDCPPNWAIVKVKVAGICSSDIARVFTKGTYHFPTIPGHEFSGEVYAVGKDSDSDWIGKKVGVFPLIPCRKCPQCADKHYEMCSHYDYLGSRRDGGFAEYVAVPIWNLIELPQSIDYYSAAMLEPLSVALHAIKQGGTLSGKDVAVIGTGMIGISAAQWTRKYDANSVTVIGRNESKRAIVENSGVLYKICTNAKDTLQYDFVLEAVGTPSSVAIGINITRPGGMVLLMGNPSGDMHLNQNDYWRILRKQLSLKGTWNSSFDGRNNSDWTEAVEALTKKEIITEPLVTHCFSQEQLNEGLNLMKDHHEPYCKVLTIWNN